MSFTVPKMSLPQVAVQVGAGPAVDTSVSSEAYGGGLGAGLASLGGALNDIVEEERGKARETAVLDAETSYRSAIEDILSGPTDAPGTGFEYYDGEKALREADSVATRIDELGEEISTGLPDDETRLAFKGHRDRLAFGAHSRIQSYAAAAGKKYEADVQERAQESFRQSGVNQVLSGDVGLSATPSLPDAAKGAAGLAGGTGTEAPRMLTDLPLVEDLAVAHSAFRAHVARNRGLMTPESEAAVTEAGLQDISSKFWIATIRAALTPGPNQSDEVAQALYDKHWQEMDADTREEALAMVTHASEVGQTQRMADDIWATHARDKGTWSDRQNAMYQDVPDDAPPGVKPELGKRIDQAREDERQGQADLLEVFDAMQKNGAGVQDLRMDSRWNDLTAAGQRQIEGRQKQDDSVYLEIVHEAAHDPDAFYKRNLLESYDLLGDEHYKELRAIQKDHEAGDDTKQKAIQTTEGIASDAAAIVATSYILESSKATARATFVANFFDALRARKATISSAGKPWDEEAEAVALRDRMLTDVVYDKDWFTPNEHGLVGTLKPEKIKVEDIPDDMLASIRQRIGADADDATVREAYLYWLTFGELPE